MYRLLRPNWQPSVVYPQICASQLVQRVLKFVVFAPFHTVPQQCSHGYHIEEQLLQQSDLHRKIDFKLPQNATNSWSIHMEPTCRPTTSIIGRKKYKTRQFFMLSEAKSVFSSLPTKERRKNAKLYHAEQNKCCLNDIG